MEYLIDFYDMLKNSLKVFDYKIDVITIEGDERPYLRILPNINFCDERQISDASGYYIPAPEIELLENKDAVIYQVKRYLKIITEQANNLYRIKCRSEKDEIIIDLNKGIVIFNDKEYKIKYFGRKILINELYKQILSLTKSPFVKIQGSNNYTKGIVEGYLKAYGILNNKNKGGTNE